MQDSIANLSSYYAEIIVEYFDTSYKKGDEILHLYLKEVNSIPKEYQSRLSSKGSLTR
jgi:hypothetical protein